jgi:hypothetical protein
MFGASYYPVKPSLRVAASGPNISRGYPFFIVAL